MRTGRTMMAASLAAVVLAAAPAIALAHAELTESDPAAGATLAAPPDEVVLTFSAELDPDASAFVVTDAGGGEVGHGEVDLDVAERNIMRGAVAIDRPGTFEVRWTSVATDGHTEEGSFAFTVDGGDGAEPDTALPRPAWPATLIGIIVLALAIASTHLRRRAQ